MIQRFEIPSSIVADGKGLSAITIDDDDCANSFAYISDWMNNALTVYSAAENRAWRFDHNFFHFNPHEGDFSVEGKFNCIKFSKRLVQIQNFDKFRLRISMD